MKTYRIDFCSGSGLYYVTVKRIYKEFASLDNAREWARGQGISENIEIMVVN